MTSSWSFQTPQQESHSDRRRRGEKRAFTPPNLADPGRRDLLLELPLPSHPLLLGLDVFLLPVLDREPRDVLILLLEGGKELKDVCGEGRSTPGKVSCC